MDSEFFKMMVRNKVLYWAAGFIFGSLGILLIVVLPLRAVHGAQLKEIQELKTKIMMTELTSSIKDLEVVLKEKQEELKKLQMRTLKPGEQAKVISLLTRISEDLGVTILNIQPSALEKKEDPQVTTPPDAETSKINPLLFQLEMEGEYKILGSFFDRLEKSPLAVTLEKWTLQPLDGKTPFRHLKTTLAAYEEMAANHGT